MVLTHRASRGRLLDKGWKTLPLREELAADLVVLESLERAELSADEGAEMEVSQWAWKALQGGRMFCYASRMRRLAQHLPRIRRGALRDEDKPAALDHRQRAMVSAVLTALTDRSVHKRQQLAEIFVGCGALSAAVSI
ncbi:hypothetical protein DIPPA_70194 [Diplonema papillatum]|nr:hypothetical protein DIPPA_70194 [Diplonema papillatum]